jgi:hypothetical protein
MNDRTEIEARFLKAAAALLHALLLQHGLSQDKKTTERSQK